MVSRAADNVSFLLSCLLIVERRRRPDIQDTFYQSVKPQTMSPRPLTPKLSTALTAQSIHIGYTGVQEAECILRMRDYIQSCTL